MRKRRKQQDESQERKNYPYWVCACSCPFHITEKDIGFVLLSWLGMPGSRAYRICYGSTADEHSIATMASRKGREDWFEHLLWNLKRFKGNGYDFKDIY